MPPSQLAWGASAGSHCLGDTGPSRETQGATSLQLQGGCPPLAPGTPRPDQFLGRWAALRICLPIGNVEKEKVVVGAGVLGPQAWTLLSMVPLAPQRAEIQPPMPSVVW